MAVALDPREGGAGEQLYILKSDRDLPEEKQTKWYIRPLTEGEWAHVMDVAMRPDSGHASVAMATLVPCLLRCENFPDKHGEHQDVERVLGRTTEAFLGRIDWPGRIEMADAIQKLSRLGEPDVEKPTP